MMPSFIRPRRFATGAGPSSQRGLSIIEILVALVLGLLVVASVGQILIGGKQTHRTEDQLAQIQDNARLALSYLVHDLRLVGNLGCMARLQDTQLRAVANPPLLYPGFRPGLDPLISGGNDAEGGLFVNPSPALSTTLGNARTIADAVEGTDAITIQFAEPIMAPCRGNLLATLSDTDPNQEIYPAPSVAPAGCQLSEGQPVLVSDCATATIFRVDTTGAQNTLGGTSLGTNYVADGSSDIRLFRAYTYYIRLNEGNPPQPSLYRLDNNQALSNDPAAPNPVELVEGVEDLQILYGVDTDTLPGAASDGMANRYLDAAAIAGGASNWLKVTSVRITLTARSLEDNMTLVERYYPGTDSMDKRLIFDSVTLVQLRNRL